MSITLLQRMKPKEGNAHLESEAMALLRGGQPGPKSRKWGFPTKRPERTEIIEWVEEVQGLWKRELSWFGYRCVMCTHPAFLFFASWTPLSQEKWTHSAWLKPGPNSLATVIGTWQEQCQTAPWDLMCRSWERVYLFPYKITSLKVGWFLVYLIITNPYSDKGNESTFQKMANHLTTKQYYFSGYLLALLPKKWFQASLPVSLNLNFFHKASLKK